MTDEVKSAERDLAAWESRHCRICGGAGQVIVFHRLWSGGRFATVTVEHNGELIEKQIPAEVAAHCICKIGRWMRDKTHESLKRRIPDGADIIEGLSPFSFNPPSEIQADRGEVPNAPPSRAAIRGAMKSATAF